MWACCGRNILEGRVTNLCLNKWALTLWKVYVRVTVHRNKFLYNQTN